MNKVCFKPLSEKFPFSVDGGHQRPPSAQGDIIKDSRMFNPFKMTPISHPSSKDLWKKDCTSQR